MFLKVICASVLLLTQGSNALFFGNNCGCAPPPAPCACAPPPPCPCPPPLPAASLCCPPPPPPPPPPQPAACPCPAPLPAAPVCCPAAGIPPPPPPPPPAQPVGCAQPGCGAQPPIPSYPTGVYPAPYTGAGNGGSYATAPVGISNYAPQQGGYAQPQAADPCVGRESLGACSSQPSGLGAPPPLPPPPPPPPPSYQQGPVGSALPVRPSPVNHVKYSQGPAEADYQESGAAPHADYEQAPVQQAGAEAGGYARRQLRN